MYNWNQFKGLSRVKDLSPQEQARQYWMYQNSAYESSIQSAAAASVAAGAGAGSGGWWFKWLYPTTI